MNKPMSHQELIAQVKKDDVRLISLQFTDIIGTLKSVNILPARLPEALETGVWFDGSSIQGFARIFEGDMALHPDPSTYVVMPWTAETGKVARLLCDIYTPAGEPFPSDPRGILKQGMARAAKMGHTYMTGAEVEFFLFKTDNGPATRPIPFDLGSYFDSSQGDMAAQIRREMMFALAEMGINVQAAHHEVAPGQHEISVQYSDALASADCTITLKYTIKAIAQKFGVYATFMPKPIQGVNGSGMHTHQSLMDGDGRNAFYDRDDKYHLSKVAYQFMAGQLAHARGLSAIVAPTVNSYKRLVPGYEAPAYICWGQINRSALIRIPMVSKGQEKATRAELRCPDPSCNPYLAFAAMLACGLDGIERGLTPPGPMEENVFEFDDSRLEQANIQTMPGSLAEALDELKKDEVVQQALGEHVCRWFTRAKRKDWDSYRLHVSPWELERYLATA
jgi:glutamine synthetase